MKAATFHSYGAPENIQITEVPKPFVKMDEVLIKIIATTVTSADARIRGMKIPSKLFVLPARLVFGFFAPRKKILGTELSGVIESAGASVTDFKVGDLVIAGTGATLGAHAEYISVKNHSAICQMPNALSFTEAAAISFGGTTALFYLKKLAQLKPGESVLIYGASGNVGVFAIQLAKHFGAHVTAVCSDKNRSLVISLGADQCLAYDRHEFSSHKDQYDYIFEAVGKITFCKVRHLLKPEGKFLAAVMTGNEIIHMILNPFRKQKVLSGVAIETKKDLEYLVNLASERKVKPVIDHTFDFSKIAEAHRLVDSGRKIGSAVVVIDSSKGQVN